MNIKLIKIGINASPKRAIDVFSKIGYMCIPFNVNRRTHEKQKVVEVIRNHKIYSQTLKDTLIFEGIISILNRKDFWIGKPDFLIWNNEELYFCEFKSRRDTLRLNQIEWMEKFSMLPIAIAMPCLLDKDKQKEEDSYIATH